MATLKKKQKTNQTDLQKDVNLNQLMAPIKSWISSTVITTLTYILGGLSSSVWMTPPWLLPQPSKCY